MTHIVLDASVPEDAGIALQSDYDENLGLSIDLHVLCGLEGAQVAGEADLIVELIDLYVEDSSFKMQAINDAAAVADWGSLKRAAHNLQGSSATLGARQMALICQELQHVDANDASENASTLVSKLVDEFSRVRRFYADERERRLA